MDEHIPGEVAPRVGVLGARTNPEDVRRELGVGGFEHIGSRLARECHSGDRDFWSHPQLAHNEDTLGRFLPLVRPFLF